MLKTIEATINPFGQIAWSEPVQIEKSQKILITFLEMPAQTRPLKNNSPFPTATLDDVAGCLAYQGQPKTLEDMEKELAEGLLNEKTAGC
jgi:hypothetical protein